MKSTNALPLRFGRPLAAVALAALALLSLLVTLVLAQTEIPSSTSAAFIQTSGPNATLGTGDWYTNIGQGNHPHNFKIFVPCTIAPSQVLTLELFDPEVFTGTQAIDEIRGAPDDTTFQLLAPDNTVLATTTYPPSDATNDRWNLFTTFTVGGSGCGIYTLLASTSDNDDNAWRLRITHPDQVPGSGDEPTVAAFETSFQHAGPPDTLTCQSFYFFVPQTPSIRLNNFDLDFGVPGYTPVPTVDYYPPSGASPSSTASGNAVWNNGTASTRVGDVINNPQWGWWRAQICVGPGNQYIFEPEGLSYVLEEPPTPDMTLSKDDGLTDVQPGQIITYTIPYANQGAGAALDTTLTDFLPPQTTFVACSGGLDCALAGPGVVTYSLGTVPTGGSGQVTLTVQVDPGAPPAAVLTNTARLEYEDVMFNVYPPKEATDVDTVAANVDLQINKTDGGVTTVPGGVVVYTLAYTNVGTVAATGVVITETVPANTTFNAAASAPTPWSCDPFPPDVYQIANTASIGDDGANGPDPTPDDNTSSDTTPVQATPVGVDLQINKTDGGITTAPGDVVAYTLTYANVGGVTATGVVITETVPANTTFNAAASAPTTWDCADGSGPGTICTTLVDSLAPNDGGTATFALTVDNPLPSGVTQIANTASIGDDGASGPDPTPQNNVSSDTTPVNVPVPAPTSNPPSEKKKKTHAAEAEPTATPVMAPPAAPAPPPTATPAVLFLPETGEGGPPADVRWPLALLVPGLLAGVGWAVYRRRV
jgi:uncharacterized repeat protein (TIGR01451 family)